MSQHYIRNLEQAKSLLDYFLETDLSLLLDSPALYNMPETSTPNRSTIPPPRKLRQMSYSEYLTISTVSQGNIIIHVPSQVSYLKAAKDYTYLILCDRNQHLVSGNIEKWAQRLEQYDFMRIHRSFCINPTMVRSWKKCNRHLLVAMEGKDEVIVAASYKQSFLRYFIEQRYERLK